MPVPIFSVPTKVEFYKNEQRKRAINVVLEEGQLIKDMARKYGINAKAVAGTILYEGIVIDVPYRKHANS